MPVKNMTSNRRIKKIAISIGNDCIPFLVCWYRRLSSRRRCKLEMVDSRPYGKTGTAALAARHFFCRAVDAAFFDRRARAFLAYLLCLGSVCSPLLRTFVEGESKPSQGFAAWNPGCLSHGLSLVYR